MLWREAGEGPGQCWASWLQGQSSEPPGWWPLRMAAPLAAPPQHQAIQALKRLRSNVFASQVEVQVRLYAQARQTCCPAGVYAAALGLRGLFIRRNLDAQYPCLWPLRAQEPLRQGSWSTLRITLKVCGVWSRGILCFAQNYTLSSCHSCVLSYSGVQIDASKLPLDPEVFSHQLQHSLTVREG